MKNIIIHVKMQLYKDFINPQNKMIMHNILSMKLIHLPLRLIALYFIIGVTPINAATSDWSQDFASKLRLIAPGGVPRNDGRFIAAIEIRMKSGWKTYWLNPGEFGFPPSIDFLASKNLADIEVLFPTPIHFKESDTLSIGYQSNIVLPLLIKPIDHNQPVYLNLTMNYGVCETLCVPASGQVTIQLKNSMVRDGHLAQIMRQAMDKIPHPASHHTPHIIAIDQNQESYSIHISGLKTKQTDLFSYSDGERVGTAIKIKQDHDGTAEFRIPRLLRDEAKTKPTKIHSIIVDGKNSYQHDWVLD